MSLHRSVLGLGLLGSLLLALSSCNDNIQGLDCGPGTVEMDGACHPGNGACAIGTRFDEESQQCQALAWTEVAAGELVHLSSNDSELSITSLDGNLEPLGTLCSGCANS
ncbi:MAG: hypothetical protein GY811_21825 [Myxococcales bacterium]|nr:hypothetical protein [Myxococcales bacterium]